MARFLLLNTTTTTMIIIRTITAITAPIIIAYGVESSLSVFSSVTGDGYGVTSFLKDRLDDFLVGRRVLGDGVGCNNR